MRGDLRILGLVMAGGEGTRLTPLTEERSKPAVPFGGSYRIVDFVLSNLLNSGIYSNFVLVQYRSQSLIHHLREGWRLSTPHPDDFLTVVPPQMRVGKEWYRGTADAVYQNFNLIYDYRPDLIAVFGADHVYRMHIGHMVHFHRKKKADVSVAMLSVPVEEARDFGVAQRPGRRHDRRVGGKAGRSSRDAGPARVGLLVDGQLPVRTGRPAEGAPASDGRGPRAGLREDDRAPDGGGSPATGSPHTTSTATRCRV